MIEKLAKYGNNIKLGRVQIEALNKPVGWEIFDGEHELSISRIKLASITLTEVSLGGFDLTSAVKEHPDHLFAKIFAIKKDEVNENGDAFNEEELRKAASSFIGVPVFCNHANDDIEKARGKVVHAWYDDDRGGIYIISMVDKIAYPKLARGIEEGYITGTSMGCQVHHSLCSICHNKAHVADEYCSHIKERKTKKFSGKVKCHYHKSKCKPDDACPICGCEKGDTVEIDHKEATVNEDNKGLKFIEDSFVVNPACPDCLVDCILNVPEFTRRVAAISGKLEKMASTVGDEKIVKIAGQKEIEFLNQAMKNMKVVANSMMNQSRQVSMEYVSDIVDVLASLQTVTDELVEMGYATIPSPQTLENPDTEQDIVSPQGSGGIQTTPQNMPHPSPVPQPSSPQLSSPQMSGALTSPAGGGIGSVTKPTFSPTADGKLKELQKRGANIRKRISSLSNTLSKIKKGTEVDYHLTRNNITVTAAKNNDGGIVVTAFVGDKPVRTVEEHTVGKWTEAFRNNPDEAALTLIAEIEKEEILTNTSIKESESNMNKNEKTAAGSALKSEVAQVTTEKQLNESAGNLEFAGKRQNKEIDGITESDQQLGQSKEPVNDTTSRSSQVRQGDYANETTENQLQSMSESAIAPWNSAPDVITEKQWTDFSRLVGAKLNLDQDENITETMLQDLRKNHRWVSPNFTTENQLASDENWLLKDNAWLDKKTASAYAKHMITAATNALSDAIAYYKRTPQEISKAASFITKDPHSQIKAAFLVLVNALPAKIASRKAEKARSIYFDKVAGTLTNYQPTDVLLACMGDHCQGIKAEDFVDAVEHIASDPAKMLKIEQSAMAKITSSPVENDFVVDKFSALDEAFKTINGGGMLDATQASITGDDSDGLYQVQSTLDEIGVPASDKAKFIAAVEDRARQMITAANVSADVVLYTVEVDTENGTVSAIMKDASKLSDQEKQAAENILIQKRAAARQDLVKESQMMGGQMGGGMGGDPSGGMGGGTTMPMPPAAGAPGAPAAPIESMDAAGETDEESVNGNEGHEPTPPGTTCPLCGSRDVDVVSGQGKCNNPECGAKYDVKVQITIKEGPGIAGSKSENEGEEGEEDSEGEGFPMPEGAEGAEAMMGGAGAGAPNIPVAAMVRITPGLMKKLASIKGWELGKFSPLTGSDNTYKIANRKRLCLDTGTPYEFEERISEGNVNDVFMQFSWMPKVASGCTSCNRSRLAWTKALKTAGLTDSDFDSMSFKKKADTIISMAAKGAFAVVKTASKGMSVTAEYQKQSKIAAKDFPMDACRQKLANRYGENALAISGPCKGEKISDCVCNQLKKAMVYSDPIAYKVAEAWSDKDACLECMEDYVRIGLDLEKAAMVCQHMKVKYASDEEILAEEMTEDNREDNFEDNFEGSKDKESTDNISEDDQLTDEDPFADNKEEDLDNEAGEIVPIDNVIEIGGDNGPEIEIGAPTDVAPHGTVTIQLPLSALDAIEQAIDLAHGEDPRTEPEHNISPNMEDKEVSIDLPEDIVEPLEDAAEDGLEEFTGDDISPEFPEMEVELELDVDDGDGDGDGDGDDDGDDAPDSGAGEESTEFEADADEPASFEGESEVNETKSMVAQEPRAGTGKSSGGDQIPDEVSRLASYMRVGRQGRVGEINLDVSGILTALKKQAGDVEIKQEKAQDVVGKYKDGKTLGNEDKFDPAKPSIPRNQATMGNEPSDLNPKDKPQPKIPAGGGEMGNEKEQGYTSEAPNMTGGVAGAGKTETAGGRTGTKVAGHRKNAGEKQIEPKKPVSDVIEIPFSNNQDLKSTPDKLKRKPFDENDQKEVKNIPEKGEGAFIGDEKTSIGEIPKDQRPSIPVGGGRNPKYDRNERYAPDHQTNIKGTVIAKDEKSKAVSAEAVRIAGRMIEAKLIDATQLMQKIAELSQYQLPQLADIDRTLFKSAEKGFATGSDGMEQPVPIINEASSQPRSLSDQLRTMFKLDQQNRIATELTDADIRKAHNR